MTDPNFHYSDIIHLHIQPCRGLTVGGILPCPLTLSFTLWLTWTNEINRCDMSRGLKVSLPACISPCHERTCHIYSADPRRVREIKRSKLRSNLHPGSKPSGNQPGSVNLKSMHRHSSKKYMIVLSHGVLGSISCTSPTVTAVWDRAKSSYDKDEQEQSLWPSLLTNYPFLSLIPSTGQISMDFQEELFGFLPIIT